MVTERDKQIAVRRLHHAATNIETARHGSFLSKDDFRVIEPWRFVFDQARAENGDTTAALGSFCVADKNCVRLGEIAVEQDVHQPGLADGEDFRYVSYRRRQSSVHSDDTHAPRPLGHQQSAVRQECERPWIYESAGDGLDFQIAG